MIYKGDLVLQSFQCVYMAQLASQSTVVALQGCQHHWYFIGLHHS